MSGELFNYLIVPVIVFIGGVTAWEDFRVKKIRNRYLKMGIAASLMWLLALTAWVYLSGGDGAEGFYNETSLPLYMLYAGLNFLCSFAVAFILWWLNIWPAGDAKLFSVLALMVPLPFYANNYLDYFPSFVLFFNSYFGLFVFIVLEFFIVIIYKFFKKKRYKQLGSFPGRAWKSIKANFWLYFRTGFGFLVLLVLIMTMRHFVRDWLGYVITVNKTVMYVILFLLFEPMSKLFAKTWALLTAIGLVLVAFVYTFFSAGIDAVIELVTMGWIAVSLISFMLIYDYYNTLSEFTEIHYMRLRRNMVLPTKQIQEFTGNSDFNNEALGDLSPEGLSDRQVDVIKSWYREHLPDGTIKICRTIPFAPSMLFGVIATIIFKGYIIML